MVSTLTYKILRRIGGGGIGGATVTPSDSIDFNVDGVSLLRALVKVDGGHGDFMGCIVQGHPAANNLAAARLRLEALPDTESGRVLLYVCPECGDIGCGAYSVLVKRDHDSYIWSDFAYENGYEPPRVIHGIGPFRFSRVAYEEALRDASAR